MSCHALRVLPTYPYGGGKYAGDIIPMGSAATPEKCQDALDGMPNRDHFEIVEVDENWQAIDAFDPCPYCADRTAAFLRWNTHLDPDERNTVQKQLDDACGGPACREPANTKENP